MRKVLFEEQYFPTNYLIDLQYRFDNGKLIPSDLALSADEQITSLKLPKLVADLIQGGLTTIQSISAAEAHSTPRWISYSRISTQILPESARATVPRQKQ